MTAAIPSGMNHPTDETLAAFTDTKLSPAERQEVIRHMAECADCREVVMWTTEMKAVEEPVAANVKTAAFGGKTWVPLAAAAAAIALIVAVPMMRPNAMNDVVKTAKTVKERPSDARLDLDIPYKRARSVPRGGEVEVGSTETEIAALNAVERVDKKPTVENLHAAGIAYMYDGKSAEALEMLERAAKAEKTPSIKLLNNLTAAYLASGRYQDALATADRSLAVEQNLVALWNRALALEWGGRYDDAVIAWRKYQEMDPQSPWATEASERIADLERLR